MQDLASRNPRSAEEFVQQLAAKKPGQYDDMLGMFQRATHYSPSVLAELTRQPTPGEWDSFMRRQGIHPNP